MCPGLGHVWFDMTVIDSLRSGPSSGHRPENHTLCCGDEVTSSHSSWFLKACRPCAGLPFTRAVGDDEAVVSEGKIEVERWGPFLVTPDRPDVLTVEERISLCANV